MGSYEHKLNIKAWAEEDRPEKNYRTREEEV